jgi:hypothetical protein
MTGLQLNALTSRPLTSARKSAVLGPDGGFSFANLQQSGHINCNAPMQINRSILLIDGVNLALRHLSAPGSKIGNRGTSFDLSHNCCGWIVERASIIERFIGTVRKPDDGTVAVVDDGVGGRDLAFVRPVITNNPEILVPLFARRLDQATRRMTTRRCDAAMQSPANSSGLPGRSAPQAPKWMAMTKRCLALIWLGRYPSRFMSETGQIILRGNQRLLIAIVNWTSMLSFKTADNLRIVNLSPLGKATPRRRRRLYQ